METKWIKVYKKFDLREVAQSLLVIGTMQADCYACKEVGLREDSIKCPHCNADFKFITFRSKPSQTKIESYSNFTLIDFESFSDEMARYNANSIFSD